MRELGTGIQQGDAIGALQLQGLLDSIREYAIFMLSTDGHIASWNLGATEVTGFSATEALAQSFSRFFGPDETLQCATGLLATAAKSGRAEREGWQLRKGGGRFWASTIIHSSRDTSGRLTGYSCVMRDITERMAAQDALQESERRFRLLVEGVTDYAIYMIDPSGIVVNWNAGAERLKGYKAPEIVGEHFSRFYSREDRAAGLPARVLDIAAREGRYEAEGWRIRKDGSRFWALVVLDAIRGPDGALIGYGKITRDISERRAAQDALRESERQFRLLVEGVMDYALYMLDPNGVVTSWNGGAARIKGYTANEIIGQHFSRFYTEEDRATGRPSFALQTALKDGRFASEGWRMRKDGSLFWASVVIHPIRDEKGNLLGYAKITRDITERRDAQTALQEAQAQRNQAQKMEALGHLTGGVAHDFNNLLMIVSGQNQTLKRLVGDNPKGNRAAEAVEMAVSRGASLTRQLLTFSRRQTLTPQVIDIPHHIEKFKTMLMGTMGGLHIVASIPPGIWPTKVDPNELGLSLLNLTINARDAMPNGGTITISAENATLKSEDTAAGIAGEFVALTIADTGTGIAPDVLPKIFDPFFTTKGAEKGSGLGLSQVHGFSHQSGGTVTITSRLGEGTQITLYLPRAANMPSEDAVSPGSENSGSGAVLLVEDNAEVAEVTCGMLQTLGYEVHVVTDASAGLAVIGQRRFRFVISDIVMAGEMDGAGLARALRNSYPDLPVIRVTGYSNSALADGEFPLMRKPYDLAELGRTIRSVLAMREAKPSNLVHLRPQTK
jgi:PAS domain S-box-containing protein